MNIKCSRCKLEKDEDNFCNNRSKKNGKDSLCRDCRRIINNEWSSINRDKRRAAYKVYYTENKERLNERSRKWEEKNPDKVAKQRKQYNQNHKEEKRVRTREWQKKNPERAKEIQKRTVKKNWDTILANQRAKRAIDPKYRIMNRMRSGFKGWLNGTQKTCSVMDLIGLSKEDFIDYIEKQFTTEMRWDNIHIDHYVPLSYFNPQNNDDMKIAWNYRNLRPLLGMDNIIKNNTLPEDYLVHIENMRKNIFA